MPAKLGKMTGDLLLAENVFVSIGGRQILHGATLRAERGRITGLLGRNGAGKSTLLTAIYGTKNVDDRTITINGQQVNYPYKQPGLLNYLPQKKFLPDNLKLKQLANAYKLNTKTIFSVFPELANSFGKHVSALSGGEERLWSVLAILMAPTRFSLLDEPFSHIMPLHVERLKQLVIIQKERKGIVITDHMYRHLLEVSDNIMLMKEGRSVVIRHRDDLVLHGYLSNISYL